MSKNDSPAETPSSISRDKADIFALPGVGVESILGKRKSEQRPPAGAKRHATTFPSEEERPTEEVYNAPRPDSPSSTSDADEHERLEHDRRADVSRDSLPPKPTSRLSPAIDVRDPTFVSRKHIFKTRLVRRRQSISTLGSSNDIAEEAVDTKYGKDAGWGPTSHPQTHNLAFPTVYRIECPEQGNKFRRHETFLYEDDPLMAIFTDGRRSSHLSGKKPIYQLRDYVRHFQQPSFVIIKNQQCRGQLGLSRSQRGRDETMLILNDDLRQAIQKVATCPLEGFLKDASLEMHAPYQLLYFHRELLQTYSQSVNAPLRREIEAVVRYINTNYGHEYAEAEELISQHKITIRHLDKISRPNHLVVVSGNELEDGQPEVRGVYVVKGWPRVNGTMVSLHCWCWEFTALKCLRSYVPFGFTAPVEDENEPFPLGKLGVYPFSVLSKESVEFLCMRGRKSWGLRQLNFVYCTESDYVKPGRYMIDQMTYNRLHSRRFGGTIDGFETRNKQTDPWRLSLGFQDEPTEDEFLMMPTKIPGYDLLEKEWINLPVPNITPIRWSKQPFEDLVLPEETKRLVRAMVTVRASSIKTKREEQRLRADFDIIPGKGNGLIMLFHGSPGTGKTLTAESVAEIAEMPLYPITCGDIGTEPDKVEQYLQLVFELGKRWNCVLLLDEADVFLEERTLTDLQRNSLVSVFLRMLEYYEGILILTSNRVGTFDEAFRSRIHIALHYEDLKPRSRRQIWSNFLARLEGTEEGENVDDIRDRLDELANHKLNGREIRNALSTARQLASHECKKMGWEHLELAIKTANDFGKYLRDFHGHSDRDWAREKKERW
ncbi:P-loop containing nucleoside triphosphate hydrolase protein [Zopfia rhizophila CBS 207.26]|uniref:P-loop containing nucleoside triphosphate hydrolase protein n=1 Tax=Zopfia rhizophila CBS 207.26 TaxID=1314779 RepID=A0A6A6DGL3_9PEZI|nr:P-loop containing nucleoside triphosphate hydrolase protein [Zopfia rhizophila CBS 207.26]